MNLITCWATAVAVALTALSIQAVPADAFSNNDWDDASTIARDALVVAALGLPVLNRDWKGGLQAAASLGVTFGVTEGLKQAFPERRPDNSGNDSFPSGHTSAAFAAAATLENRYGWQAGFPAFVVASFVGVARHEANKHHWYDVAAGAVIGTGSGFLITTRRDSQVRFVPWADSNGAGFLFGTRF